MWGWVRLVFLQSWFILFNYQSHKKIFKLMYMWFTFVFYIESTVEECQKKFISLLKSILRERDSGFTSQTNVDKSMLCHDQAADCWLYFKHLRNERNIMTTDILRISKKIQIQSYRNSKGTMSNKGCYFKGLRLVWLKNVRGFLCYQKIFVVTMFPFFLSTLNLGLQNILWLSRNFLSFPLILGIC